MKAWMRVLRVTLTSRKLKKQMVFGNSQFTTGFDLAIDVSGYKYLSSLKDNCTVKLTNLTYNEVMQIIVGEFYDVKIEAGYRDSSVQTIFDGGVLYISNAREDATTNTVIILCASKLVARYGQSRINLTLNSGINMYSAIKFGLKRAGISEVTISEQLKKRILSDKENVADSPQSWIDKLTKINDSFCVNADSSVNPNSIVSIFDANRSNARVITLKRDQLDLSSGYPRLTSDGLSMAVLPTFGYMCGDVIKIDNSLIDISVTSKDEISKNYGKYFDEEGCYMIYQIGYTLQNRGSSFSLDLTCKTQSLISNFTGT